MKQSILSQFLVAVMAAALVLGVYQKFGGNKNVIIEHVDKNPSKNALYTLDEKGAPVALDFTQVAEKSIGSVVHIINTAGVNRRSHSRGQSQNDLFDQFFGNGMPQEQGPRVGSGSGVIINGDGYIVTNNHVVKEADDLEVILNDKRKFKAKLIGTDPSTDIAVVKIEEKNLPSLKFSNSDAVKIGQWVLAIGNPFNLTSTVTAGIVSAKGRNIDIMNQQGSIESFIQTDAAINPGNSGGALIDLGGNLIGINTAIASQTGSYAGYGFAVPANLASRVVADLIQYGSTQRGYLGVTIQNVDDRIVKDKNLHVNEGAFINGVSPNGAADQAGIKLNDVVTSINDRKVTSSADLMEIVGSHRIGDKLSVKVDRGGLAKIFDVTLKNQAGTASVTTPRAEQNEDVASALGAELKAVSKEAAQDMGIPSAGVQVTSVGPGQLADAQVEEGFVITSIDRKPVTKVSDVINAIKASPNSDGVLVIGYYPGSDRKEAFLLSPR